MYSLENYFEFSLWGWPWTWILFYSGIRYNPITILVAYKPTGMVGTYPNPFFRSKILDDEAIIRSKIILREYNIVS